MSEVQDIAVSRKAKTVMTTKWYLDVVKPLSPRIYAHGIATGD